MQFASHVQLHSFRFKESVQKHIQKKYKYNNNNNTKKMEHRAWVCGVWWVWQGLVGVRRGVGETKARL